MTVLIDSWSWIEYLKGGPHSKAVAAYIESDEEAVVSVLNITEVYFWIMKSCNEGMAKKKMTNPENPN